MKRQSVLRVLCLVSLLVPGLGCVRVVEEGPGGGGGGGGGSDEITVRLVNTTSNRAVDVQLFVTGQTVSDLDTEFFVAENQLFAGIGFAGSGILESGRSDEVVLACTDALIVGTRGGRFLDEDTGGEIGRGTQYVLIQGPQFSCGSTITFTYGPSGDGFRTSVAIAAPGE